MNRRTILIVMSLVSIVLLSLHFIDDVVRGISEAGFENMTGVLILLVPLYGTLVLTDRKPGLVIMFLGGLFATAMPMLHLSGRSIGTIATSSGGFFFMWTLWMLGVTGIMTMILVLQELWRLRTRRPG